MLALGLIGENDLDRLLFCNQPEEAISTLMQRDGRLLRVA